MLLSEQQARVEAGVPFEREIRPVVSGMAREFGHPDLADDCLQAGWVSLARTMRNRRAPVRNFRAYVFKCMLRAARKLLVSERRHEGDPLEDDPGCVPEPEPDLSYLTERQVIVSELYQSGMTQEQIAEQLGVSQPAVSQLLKRAQRNIRRGSWR